MDESRPSASLVIRATAVVWSLVACLAALDVVATAFVNRAPLTSWRAFVPAVAEWYLWVPLTPLVVWLGRRFSVGRSASWVNWLPHMGGIVATSAIRGALYFWTTVRVEGIAFPGPTPVVLWRLILGFMPVAAILYGGILVVDMAAG